MADTNNLDEAGWKSKLAAGAAELPAVESAVRKAIALTVKLADAAG